MCVVLVWLVPLLFVTKCHSLAACLELRIHIVEGKSEEAAARHRELSCQCSPNNTCTYERLDDLCGKTKFFCCTEPRRAYKHKPLMVDGPSKLGPFPLAPEFDDTPLDEQPEALLLSPARAASHSIIIKSGPHRVTANLKPAVAPPVFIGGATGIIEPTRLRSMSVLYNAKPILGPVVDEVQAEAGVLGPGRHVLLAYNRFKSKN